MGIWFGGSSSGKRLASLEVTYWLLEYANYSGSLEVMMHCKYS